MPGLTVNGLDLRSADKRFQFALMEGLYELPDFDGGDNTIVTGAPGEIVEDSIARRLTLKFDGWIHGIALTPEDQLTDFLANFQTWREAVAPQTDGVLSGTVVVELTNGYLGTSGTYSIDAKYVGAMWDERIANASRHGIFTMVAVGSPPDPPAWSPT
jgi:hypothetical protein